MTDTEVIDSKIVYLSQIKYKTRDGFFDEQAHFHENVFIKLDQVYSI